MALFHLALQHCPSPRRPFPFVAGASQLFPLEINHLPSFDQSALRLSDTPFQLSPSNEEIGQFLAP
jgi:hypothetical protein